MQGAVTVVGQAFVNLKCMWPNMGFTDGDVFYTERLVWSIFPLVLVVCNGMTWSLLALCKKRNRKWTVNNIKASTVAICYLLWPSLCSQTFSLLACRTVCGTVSVNSYFISLVKI